MAMNKVTADLVRNVLKIGGAALATSGLLPAQCAVTDPTLAQSSGLVLAIAGVVWGVVSAKRHQALKEEVEGAS